jgi:hypothetical protein
LGRGQDLAHPRAERRERGLPARLLLLPGSALGDELLAGGTHLLPLGVEHIALPGQLGQLLL